MWNMGTNMGTNMGHNLNDFKIETLDIEWGQSVTVFLKTQTTVTYDSSSKRFNYTKQLLVKNTYNCKEQNKLRLYYGYINFIAIAFI